MSTLDDLYLDELRDAYNMETQILKALPKMAKAATSQDLRNAFQEHEQQTQNQVSRLDQIFQMHNMKSRGKKCAGMEGILEEGKEMMQEDLGEALDAAMIAGAQKVEHYEMATYGALRTWAQELGRNDEARLLQQTLDEEGETDKKLTRLAESRANVQAEQGDGGMR